MALGTRHRAEGTKTHGMSKQGVPARPQCSMNRQGRAHKATHANTRSQTHMLMTSCQMGNQGPSNKVLIWLPTRRLRMSTF